MSRAYRTFLPPSIYTPLNFGPKVWMGCGVDGVRGRPRTKGLGSFTLSLHGSPNFHGGQQLACFQALLIGRLMSMTEALLWLLKEALEQYEPIESPIRISEQGQSKIGSSQWGLDIYSIPEIDSQSRPRSLKICPSKCKLR
jgi:hypothetical protein